MKCGDGDPGRPRLTDTWVRTESGGRQLAEALNGVISAPGEYRLVFSSARPA